jgi:Ras-related protein Rab-2A
MEEVLLRIIIVGDSSVGKTCLLLNFTEGNFTETHDITIGVELGNRLLKVEEKSVKFQIWDTSGQETYRSVTRSFYRRADCAILVFDLTDQTTFKNCESWMREIKQNSKEDIIIFLVGNKRDLEENQTVSIELIENFVKNHHIFAFELTSAKEGINVEKVFFEIARKLLAMDKGANPKDSGKFEIQKVPVNNRKKKKCCQS